MEGTNLEKTKPINNFDTEPIFEQPEKKNIIKEEVDADAIQKFDTEKLMKLREQIGIKSKIKDDITDKRSIIEEVNGQQKLTNFEEWIEKIKKQDKIGSGAQKRIYVHPDDPKKIVAVFHDRPVPGQEKYQSVDNLKIRFYVNKILNLLYPDNVPNIHLAASEPPVLIIDRIMGKEINEMNPKHQFYKILIQRRLRKIGILADRNSFNFMADQDGKVFYIDDFVGNFGWNRERLLKKINKLHPEEKRRAFSYLNRIEVLENQSRISKKEESSNKKS